MQKLALKYFRGSERYNCAQAVLKSAEKYIGLDNNKLNLLQKMGGGRAEDGLCGALFAAKELIKEESSIDAVRNYFQKNGGSIKCKDIRKEKKMTCHECVAVAALFAEDILKTSPSYDN